MTLSQGSLAANRDYRIAETRRVNGGGSHPLRAIGTRSTTPVAPAALRALSNPKNTLKFSAFARSAWVVPPYLPRHANSPFAFMPNTLLAMGTSTALGEATLVIAVRSAAWLQIVLQLPRLLEGTLSRCLTDNLRVAGRGRLADPKGRKSGRAELPTDL